ncbi:hypothetical protein IFO70_31070 [Phormidium tenue FACHB-886]|nr:hypothetical protein [Phormidium tenue FACHB-886]
MDMITAASGAEGLLKASVEQLDAIAGNRLRISSSNAYLSALTWQSEFLKQILLWWL